MIFGFFKMVSMGYQLWVKLVGPKLFWLLFAAASALAVILNHYV